MLARIEMPSVPGLRVTLIRPGDRPPFDVEPTALAAIATDPTARGYCWREPFLLTLWRNVK
jgi:hypothetical protein